MVPEKRAALDSTKRAWAHYLTGPSPGFDSGPTNQFVFFATPPPLSPHSRSVRKSHTVKKGGRGSTNKVHRTKDLNRIATQEPTRFGCFGLNWQRAHTPLLGKVHRPSMGSTAGSTNHNRFCHSRPNPIYPVQTQSEFPDELPSTKVPMTSASWQNTLYRSRSNPNRWPSHRFQPCT